MTKKTIKINNDKSEEGNEKESLQERYMELQMLDQQIRQLQKYLQSFDQQLVEIKSVIVAIKDFGSLKKGDVILAPIANGVFVKARLEDASHLRINVGSNVVVTKSINEAVSLLEAQEKEIVQYRSETLANMEEFMKRLEGLQSD